MILAAALLFTAGLMFYVFGPLREEDIAHGQTKTRASYLRDRKDQVYENLRDLNFEYKAGKFPEADYLALRAGLEEEAAAILAEIETLEAPAASGHNPAMTDRGND